MEVKINNGIINVGDNNINISNTNINFDEVIKELKILSNYTKEDYSEAIKAAEEKNINKLISILRNIKSFTLELIKNLSLSLLTEIFLSYFKK